MTAIMTQIIDDSLVPIVKSGIGGALYVWGVVIYDDIFKKRRKTTFLQRYYWNSLGDFDIHWNRIESPQGQYLARHNKAN